MTDVEYKWESEILYRPKGDELIELLSDIEIICNNCSFFQSSLWVSCWINILQPSDDYSLIICRLNQKPVAQAIVVRRTKRLLGFIPVTRAWLGETGDRKRDIFAIEHNGILCKKGPERRAIHEVLTCLFSDSSNKLDELRIPGVTSKEYRLILEAAKERDLALRIYDQKPYYWVDLSKLRADSSEFNSSLSKNTRYQIKRSQRLYESEHKIALTHAKSVEEALSFFSNLMVLHQQYWQSKKKQGAFASTIARKFHECLIADGFKKGKIHLLKISAGNNIIGYLYNLVQDKTVYSYQSGFNYVEDARFKPGLVCHSMAVSYYLRAGYSVYDFLAGDSQYKRSLATNIDQMYWVCTQRRDFRQRAEERARSLKAMLQGYL